MKYRKIYISWDRGVLHSTQQTGVPQLAVQWSTTELPFCGKPQAMYGLKVHLLSICQRHVSLRNRLYPRSADSPTAGFQSASSSCSCILLSRMKPSFSWAAPWLTSSYLYLLLYRRHIARHHCCTTHSLSVYLAFGHQLVIILYHTDHRSPLISLEELWKCVMQKWVDGERVCVWERVFRWRMFVCRVCVLVKQQDTCVGFCCVRRPNWEHPRLVPVCIGSRPSTFCSSAPSGPVHHRLEEGIRWDLEPTFAYLHLYTSYETCFMSQYFLRHRRHVSI